MDVKVPPGAAVKGAGVIPGAKLAPVPGIVVAGADEEEENPGVEVCALQQICPNCVLVLESQRDALSNDVT